MSCEIMTTINILIIIHSFQSNGKFWSEIYVPSPGSPFEAYLAALLVNMSFFHSPYTCTFIQQWTKMHSLLYGHPTGSQLNSLYTPPFLCCQLYLSTGSSLPMFCLSWQLHWKYVLQAVSYSKAEGTGQKDPCWSPHLIQLPWVTILNLRHKVLF